MRLILSLLVMVMLCAAQVDFPTPVTIYPKSDGSEAGSLKILKADGTCCAFEFKGVSTEATTFGSFRIVSTTGDPRATMSASGLLLFYGGGGNSITINRNGASVWFYEHPDNGTDYIEVKAPDLLAAPYTFRFPSGAGTNTHCLKTDGTGATYWDACAGAGSLPVVDTTAIVKDDGDNTKLLRFEASLITTGTTRALSAQDANYTIAGLETAQTFTALNQFTVNRPAGHALFNRNTAVDGISGPAFFDDGGTARGGVGWRNASDAVGPNSLTLHTLGAHPVQFATNNTVRAFVDDGGLRPKTANTYDNGSSSLYWKDSWNKQVYTETLRISNNPGTFSTAFYMKMNAGSNQLEWYDPGNTLVLNVNASVSPRRWTVLGDISPIDTATGTLGFYAYWKSVSARNVIGLTDNSSPAGEFTAAIGSIAPEVVSISGTIAGKRGVTVSGTPAIVFSGDVLPGSSGAHSVGSSVARVLKLWTLDLDATAVIADVNGFRPKAANTYDNGSSSLYWKDSWNKQVYTETLRISNNPGTFSTAFYMKMNAGSNQLEWYDPGNTLVLNVNASVSPRRWTVLGDISPIDTATGTLGFYAYWKSVSARNVIGLTDNSTSAGNFTAAIGSIAPEVLYVSGALASKRGITVAGTPAIVFSGDVLPGSNLSYSIGSSFERLSKLWAGDLDISGNSTITVGTGSFYLRHFSGGDANCAGVANGWMGVRTDTNELQVCIGSAMKKVSLL